MLLGQEADTHKFTIAMIQRNAQTYHACLTALVVIYALATWFSGVDLPFWHLQIVEHQASYGSTQGPVAHSFSSEVDGTAAVAIFPVISTTSTLSQARF